MAGQREDFDFLHGRWKVVNHRLRTQGARSSDWATFEANSRCEPYLDGLMNVDEIRFPSQGFVGTTVRVFDLHTSEWSIWWIDSRHGRLEPPVVGSFDGVRGVFEGDDVDAGRPVRVRFVWTRAPGPPRWEQSFSYDNGASWEKNWIMDFTPEP